MSYLDNYYPSSLTLVAAAKCNLACEYCKINHSINSNSDKIFEETIKALQNGTYLNNVKTAFNRLNYSLNNITEFQIWGQEPTMVLPYITEHWEDWQNLLPNLEKTMFSTNAMHCVDEIYNFIVAANKYAKEPLRMTFQVSYDGYLGTNNARKANADLIKNNITSLIKKLNQITLHNLDEIVFAYHGVLSKEIFNNLTTLEQIENYVKEINDFLQDMHDITINKKVRNTSLTLLIVNGVNDISAEDGINLYNFIKKLNSQYYNFKDKYPYFYIGNGENLAMDIIGPKGHDLINQIINNKQDKIKKPNDSVVNNLDELIDKFLDDENHMMRTNTCKPIIGDFKIMYNGMATFCQNSLYDTEIEEDKLTNSILDQSRKYQIKAIKANLVTDPIEKVEEYVNYIKLYAHEGLLYTFMNQIANYLYLLAQVGQADSSYLYDYKKLKRHAYLLAIYNSCHWNLTIVSGSPDIRNIYDIRLLANGVLDLFEQGVEKEVNKFA